jgi:hypothetical protein
MTSMRTRLLLILGLLTTCWLGMMLVHECGHMLAAVCTGGTVTRLEWPLWGFSRTDVSPNPHPLPVAWAGPLFGAMMPALLSLALRMLRLRSVVAEIFAGFCLIANGTYLSAGSLGRIGDTAEILKHGGPLWTLWAAGLPLAAAGLAQWHALGPKFGIARVGKTEALATRALGAGLFLGSFLWQVLGPG